MQTSSTGPSSIQQPAIGKPWWRETDVVWLVLLVVGAYLLRAGDLPLRGEEPTRAQIAFEMVHWNDWIVPREQGEPFRIRPPLQNWVIAASCLAWGSWEPWAVRFPSVLATLLTTLLIYGYCRTALSRVGAFASAAAFATLADMFQMGRQAETEALFILLVSSSLLVWHWGVMRGWSEVRTFAAGYGLMALAMLTKGIQAPMYFVGTICIFLLLTGQWRKLISRAHLGGIAVAGAILSAWIIPYAMALGWPAVAKVWLGDPAVSHPNWALSHVANHLLTFPLEIAAGTLPWSVMLVVYMTRDGRRAVGQARPLILFTGICIAVAWPTCWIHPGGQPRFFAPLFPCLAVLIGTAVQRCTEADANSHLRLAWRRYLSVVAYVMVASAVAILALAGLGAPHPLLVPWVERAPVALAYAVLSVSLAVVILRVRAAEQHPRSRLAVFALACFLAITFAGVIGDVRLRRSEDSALAMMRLKERLPPGQQLVSLDVRAHSLFAYLYGEPIIALPPAPGTDPQFTYFCVFWPGDSRPKLPFDWEEIGSVSMDRVHRSVAERVVIVGRRLGAEATR